MGLSRQAAKTISRKRRAWRRRYFDGANSARFGLFPGACSAVYDEVTSTDIHPTSAGATPHSTESVLPRHGKLHMSALAKQPTARARGDCWQPELAMSTW